MDKIFGQIGAVLKSLLIEGVVDSHNILVCLLLCVPEEGGEAGEHDVGDDPDAPEVGVEGERLIVDDLRRDELRRAEHLPDLGAGHYLATEAEVDKLDCPAGVVEQHHVLRLQCDIRVTARCEPRHLEIQVSHIVTVEVLDTQQDLLDKEGRLLLCQSPSLSNEVKQFPATQAGNGIIEMSD